MERRFHSILASLIAMCGAISAGSTFAQDAKPAVQQRCFANNPDNPTNPFSVLRIGLQTTKDFRYSGQPEFQTRAPQLGATPDEIHANFAGIIEGNFQNGSAEHVLNNLSDRELGDLAGLYSTRTQGKIQPLLKILAQRLSDQALVRVVKVFGTEPVQKAVEAYATPHVRNSFNAKIVTLGLTTETLSAPDSALPMQGPAPTVDMTIPEIYLEFRTAPIGSLNPTAAISETGIFAASRLVPAYYVGTAIGSGISYLIDTYDPALSDAIGGTVAGMVDATNQSWTELKQGQYQASFDALFGYPISNSGNPSGDFDEFAPMDFYWGSMGCL